MNLSDLKPAWRRGVLENSMRSDRAEILSIIERAEAVVTNRSHRPLVITVVLVVLTFFCQGG